jgi:hypothetical protein
MKCSKYFGAKWNGFIKSESILAPKGTSHFKAQNIRCDTHIYANNKSPRICSYRDPQNYKAKSLLLESNILGESSSGIPLKAPLR